MAHENTTPVYLTQEEMKLVVEALQMKARYHMDKSKTWATSQPEDEDNAAVYRVCHVIGIFDKEIIPE